MIEAGTIEAGEGAKAADLIAMEDVIILIDPATLETVDFSDPVVIENGLGSSAIADPEVMDLGPVEVVPRDDSSIDDGGMVFVTSEWPGEDQPTDQSTDDLGADGESGRPIDPMPEWRTLGGSDDSASVDDGSVSEADIGTKGEPVEEIGTIDITMITDKDGASDDGLGTDGSFDWTFEDFVTITGGDGTPPLYTLDPEDPLIFQTLGPVEETPGRGSDPLPYERTNADPVLAAPVEAEIDRTSVNYAAADTFNTGLDLL